MPNFEGVVKVDRDVDIYARRFGEHGPRIVLIHGGPDWDHSYFLPHVDALSRQARVLLFDIRGCGRSSRLGDSRRYAMDLVADDTASLMRHFGWGHAFVLGYSYGGRVALRLAYRYGERVEGIVLASTTAYEDFQRELEGWELYRERCNRMTTKPSEILADPQLSPEEKTRRLADDCLVLDVGDLARLDAVREVVSHVRFSGEWMRAWTEGRLQKPAHPDYAAVLRAHDKPLCIVHGSLDMRFPISVARRLHAGVPTSELEVVEGAGHLALVETPDAWCRAITGFLRRHGGVPPRST